MRRIIIAPIILTIGLGSVAVLGSSPNLVGEFLESVKSNSITKVFFSPSQAESQKSNLNSDEKAKKTQNTEAVTEVPDEIIYFILFKHLIGLKEQSEKEKAADKKPVNYIELYKQQANLDEAQSQFLFQTAEDCLNATKLIDAEAKILINQSRASFPNGELPSAESLPPPPPQLNNLQQQKNQTILSYRDVFSNYLGAEKFAEFNQFARQKIAPQVTMNFVKKEGK